MNITQNANTHSQAHTMDIAYKNTHTDAVILHHLPMKSMADERLNQHKVKPCGVKSTIGLHGYK